MNRSPAVVGVPFPAARGPVSRCRKHSVAAKVARVAELPAAAHLTPNEAATYLGTTTETLSIWRHQFRGPQFKGSGGFVRYMKGQLDDFLAGNTKAGPLSPSA